MKKCFGILLVCLLLACGAALAECAICGDDGTCDACGGLGYQTVQAYGSDEMIKVICTAGCEEGKCPDCQATVCFVCSSDGKCNTCGGLGYLVTTAYGSNEEIKVACTGEHCEDGSCTACKQPAAEAPAAEGYTFQDAAVEKAVRNALGRAEGQPIALGEIETITELHLANAGVKRLSDVCRMVGLEVLDLSGNSLRTLPPLDALTELKTLNVSGNRFTSIASVKKLTKLETLDVTDTPIKDIDVLSAVPSLKYLAGAQLPGLSTPAPAVTPEPTAQPTATPEPTPNGLFLNRGVRETPKPVFDDPEPEEEEEEYVEPEYDDGGAKTITVEVIIGEDVRSYSFTTNEDYLLDALLEKNFVQGEEVAWGFNVTIVDGVKANYNRKGEYWVVLEHNGDTYVSLADSISTRRIRDGEHYAFEMMK